MQKLLTIKILNELKKIKKRYKERYGAVIFDVKIKNIDGAIVFQGIVLSRKQKNEVYSAAKEITKDAAIKNEIRVLSDPKEKLEIGWGVIMIDIADVWAKLSDKKTITGGTRATQALKGDFVRVLAEKGALRLIQTRDMAVGWINASNLAISKRETVKKKWMRGKRAPAGEIIKKRLTKNIQKNFIRFLKKYLNVPYLLGGMTDKGIDCSGLTEKFYSDIFGIILPRHSGTQALCGEKIELSSARFGDLVYMRNIASKRAHIGMVVEKFEKRSIKLKNLNNILILNARMETGRVSIEYLSEILRLYNLISVKRIIKGF